MKHKRQKKNSPKHAKHAAVATTRARTGIVMHKEEPVVFVPYDRAAAMLKPDDQVNVFYGGRQTTIPRDEVLAGFRISVRRSGKNATAAGFGLAFFDTLRGWVMVETLPKAPIRHSIDPECVGKYCAICADEATHKVTATIPAAVVVASRGARLSKIPEKSIPAFLCCHHFTTIFGHPELCNGPKSTPTPEEVPAA